MAKQKLTRDSMRVAMQRRRQACAELTQSSFNASVTVKPGRLPGGWKRLTCKAGRLGAFCYAGNLIFEKAWYPVWRKRFDHSAHLATNLPHGIGCDKLLYESTSLLFQICCHCIACRPYKAWIKAFKRFFTLLRSLTRRKMPLMPLKTCQHQCYNICKTC